MTAVVDSPEVVALRKRIRGETLSAEELALLESTYRTPTGPGATFIQEQVTALLEEMFR